MSDQPPAIPKMEIIPKLIWAVYPSFAFLASIQLDVYTPLKDNPSSAEQLADTLGLGVTNLRPLLYTLVTTGLLAFTEDRFSNSQEADTYLVKGSPTYMGSRHELMAVAWQACLHTADSIRSGTGQAKGDFDYSTTPPEKLERIFRGLHASAMAAGRNLAKRDDLSRCQTLLDVGGGSGGLAIALAQNLPHMKVTVVDLPSVTPITQRFVDEAQASERVQVVAKDVVNEGLAGQYDGAVLSSVIQTLSADNARRILINVGRAVNAGGMICIIGAVLDNSRLSPPLMVMNNIFFLNVYDGGQAYTEQEYRDWLVEAGFENITRDIQPEGHSILFARKVG